MNQILIGEIQKQDNPEIAAIVRYVLMDLGAPKVGTAYVDPQLDFMFESSYLETMPSMENAQKLYKKVGFEYLCEPLRATGHTLCPVWMLKKL